VHALLILVPFLGSFILNLPFRKVNKRLSFGVCAALFLLQMAVILIPDFGLNKINPAALANIFNFDLGVDALSKVMLFCIGLVALVTLCTNSLFLKDSDDKFNFINVLLIAVSGMNGIVLAKDIFSLYVFLEITAVASFILIAFNREELGLEGAFKYILLSSIATVLMIAGIALFFLVSGSTHFAAIHSALLAQDKSLLINLAIALFVSALFIKGGLMPFHGWLPDAYSSAPAASSVFLAGIVTKAAGVYVLIRILVSIAGFSLTLKSVLLFVGAFSAIIGAIAALTQTDFKRMLSYSSISQIGYIILGVGTGTVLGLAGAALHIFNHAVFKSLLFMNSAAVEKALGTRDISKMGGLGSQMPVTGLTSVLGSLSCAGIPPLAGFWSKLIIIIALWSAGFKTYAVIAILGSVLTLAYFLSLQRSVFFGKLNAEFKNIKEAGFSLLFPMILLGVITLGVGIFLPLVLDKFILSFNAVLGG
jgi:multicomponent Na+:H+ antiporter subunit D